MASCHHYICACTLHAVGRPGETEKIVVTLRVMSFFMFCPANMISQTRRQSHDRVLSEYPHHL